MRYLWALIYISSTSVAFTARRIIPNRFHHSLFMSPILSEWTPLDPESLVAAPCLIEQTLCQPSEDQPQLAKDPDYANAVLDAWRQQEADDDTVWSAETCKITYYDEQEQPLYGHLIRKDSSIDIDKSPLVFFFHTGAGPHDLFLLWKAAALVNSLKTLQTATVFIADILSDKKGWAWSPDRTQYNKVRTQVLETTEGSTRPQLQKRIQAAIDAIGSRKDMGSMGWCLGGHSILELARMQVPGMKCMATFHGVFDSLPVPQGEANDENTSEILICHGVDDPFVDDISLEKALETLQHFRHRTSLLQLKAKHGFTNPAQDFNPNEAFAYSDQAAKKSWKQATALFEKCLSK